MAKDFKNNIANNIEIKTPRKDNINIREKNIEIKENLMFEIGKKELKKINKKNFPLYMENDKIKQLDKVCKKTGYSRNELINIMVDFCLDNLYFKE